WRYMLAIAALPAILLFFGMLRLPESPRWLVSKKKNAEALNVLKKIRNTNQAESEYQGIKETFIEETNVKKATYKDLTVPWIRRIVFLGIGIAIVQQITGVNSIMYYG
uniref:MFS transporter n=1 Tax=Streptomyces atratus TaxID=1893 RepID=UPI0036D40358